MIHGYISCTICATHPFLSSVRLFIFDFIAFFNAINPLFVEVFAIFDEEFQESELIRMPHEYAQGMKSLLFN